jgi:transposase
MIIPPDVIGIDVAKHHLDIFDGATAKPARLSNDPETIGRWLQRLGEGRSVIFEATGAYDAALRQALSEAGVRFARVNPTAARHFAKAAGFLAKTDQVDARMLAAMGAALQPRPAEPSSPATERLARLHKRRDQLVATRKQERTRRRETKDVELLEGLDRHLAFLGAELKALEAQIAAQIAAEPALKRDAKLLISMPGVGPAVSACLMALMPELGRRSPKRIAALAGLAPVNQDSGLRRGQRAIRGGRKRVRDALYMAALSAIRSRNSRFCVDYQRLRAAGKPAKLALIAIARKLLVTANAILRDQQPFGA